MEDDEADNLSFASEHTQATSNVRTLVVTDQPARNRLPQYDIGQHDRNAIPMMQRTPHQQQAVTTNIRLPRTAADSSSSQALVPTQDAGGALTNYGGFVDEDSRALAIQPETVYNEGSMMAPVEGSRNNNWALTPAEDPRSSMVETVDERAITPVARSSNNYGGALVETVDGRAIIPSERASNNYAGALVETVDDRVITPVERASNNYGGALVETVDDRAITPVERASNNYAGALVETVDERALTPIDSREATPQQSMVVHDGSFSADETVHERAITPVNRALPASRDTDRSRALVEAVEERSLTPIDAAANEGALVPRSSEEAALVSHDGKDSDTTQTLVPHEKNKSSREVVPHKKKKKKKKSDSKRKSSSKGDEGSKAIVPKEKSSSSLVPKEKSSSSRSLVPKEKSSSSHSLVPKEGKSSSRKSSKKDKDKKKETISEESPPDSKTAPNVEEAGEEKEWDSSRSNIPRPDRGFSTTPESMGYDNSSDGDTWMDYDEGTITTNLRQSVHNPNDNVQYDHDYDSTAGDSSVQAARYQQAEEDNVAYEVEPGYVDEENVNDENSKRSARSQEKSYRQEQDNYHPDSRGSQRYEEQDSRSYREDLGHHTSEANYDAATYDEGTYDEATYDEATYEDAKSYYSASDQSDDSSTIKTYGSNYWSALSQAKKEAVTKPSTIYEDEEMSHDELRKPIPPSPAMDEASYSADSYRGSQSVSGRSVDSSQYSTSTGTGSSGMGIVQRPGTARTSRRNDSREVEVSMDGFMHQSKRSLEDTAMSGANMSGSQGSYSYMFQEGDKVQKLTPLHMYASLLAIMSLLVTVLFFAAHVGPFVVDTRVDKNVRGTQAAGGISNVITAADAVNPNEGSSSMSSALAIDGTENDVDHAWQVPAQNGGMQVVGVPLWLKESFLNSGRAYLGTNLEIPLIWTISSSGGDIVAETMSRCLSKVIAGDGYKYDVNSLHSAKFKSNMFNKISSPDGHTYINVDLFSLEGIARAGSLGLTQMRISNLAYSPFLKDSAEKLFVPVGGRQQPDVAGRLFVVARDPLERALHVYEKARVVSGNDQMTLSDFLDDPSLSENNPFTRRLLGISPSDPLNVQQADVAIKMLNRYAIVGRYDKVDESILRFEKFLSWYPGEGFPEVRQCHENILLSSASGYQVVNNADAYDSVEYNRLVGNYLVDQRVYNFMKELYDIQGQKLFPSETA